MKTGGQLTKLHKKNPYLSNGGQINEAVQILHKYSRLFFLIYHHGRSLFFQRHNDQDYEDPYNGQLPSELGLRKLILLRDESKFDFRIIVFPYFSDDFDTVVKDELLIRKLATTLGIDNKTIYLRESFRTNGGRPSSYATDGVHLSKKGHQAAAEFLQPILQKVILTPDLQGEFN